MAQESDRHQWFQAPLPFQRLALDGSIREVNREWELLSGYSAKECVGRQYTDFVPADHLIDFQRNLEQLTNTGRLAGADCYVQRKDGAVLNVRIFGRLNDQTSEAECLLVDITSFRQTERSLRDSEERFRTLFDLAPTPIFIHDGTTLVLANQSGARFLGYDAPEHLIGLGVMGFVHGDDQAMVATRNERMMQEDWTAPSTPERFIRKDGSIVHGEVVASPVAFEGRRLIHVIVLDLSTTIEAERALAESESRYRALFEFSGDAIIVHDGRHVRFANRSALASFGVSANADVTQLELGDFVHPDSLPGVAQRIGELLGGLEEDKPSEFRFLRADGSSWYAESYSVVLALQGERLIQTMLRDLTERRRTEDELAGYRARLEQLLRERTESLERVRQELNAVTTVVSRTVEMRDPYTAGHQRRVAALALEIARALKMDETDIEYLGVAARMHDVGKVSVPAEILSKPSRLSALEFELVKTHVEAGYSIVKSAELPGPVAEIVYQHHERLDGTGYPRGLVGDELLLGSRVLMVADTVEAMCSHRPYRPSIGLVAALEELDSGSGTYYDAAVVEACREVVHAGFSFTDEF
jgi:PAS domain S-box-containing protein/putative nucleotidyltransferase with HDIG domain